MALDIFWQGNDSKDLIGNLKIDNALEELLSMYEQRFGIYIDPYGSNRLYLSQWDKLIVLASQIGFDSEKLKEIQAGFPKNTSGGFLLLDGD